MPVHKVTVPSIEGRGRTVDPALLKEMPELQKASLLDWVSIDAEPFSNKIRATNRVQKIKRYMQEALGNDASKYRIRTRVFQDESGWVYAIRTEEVEK